MKKPFKILSVVLFGLACTLPAWGVKDDVITYHISGKRTLITNGTIIRESDDAIDFKTSATGKTLKIKKEKIECLISKKVDTFDNSAYLVSNYFMGVNPWAKVSFGKHRQADGESYFSLKLTLLKQEWWFFEHYKDARVKVKVTIDSREKGTLHYAKYIDSKSKILEKKIPVYDYPNRVEYDSRTGKTIRHSKRWVKKHRRIKYYKTESILRTCGTYLIDPKIIQEIKKARRITIRVYFSEHSPVTWDVPKKALTQWKKVIMREKEI